MKRTALFALALFALCPAAIARGADDAEKILAKVQKTYAGKSVTASFSQTYTDVVTGDRPTESGTLKASGDGKVRFDYAAPNSKSFVFDGNSAYFYEPEAAQVTILDHFGQEPAARTMAFLWGNGPLTTAFRGALCTSGCPEAGPKDRWLTLLPVESMAGVERVDLLVHSSSYEVQETCVTDALGNRTRYRLTGRKLGARLPDKLFHFVVPQGVSVLHTRP